MALTIASLAGFPAINSAFASTKVPTFYPTGVGVTGSNSPSPTVAATYSYSTSTTFPTNGKQVYTQGSTQYVAGIIDQQGQVPARIFYSNNGSGNYSNTTQILPTLNYIIQNQYTDPYGFTEYGGYVVVLTPAEPGPDSGQSATTGNVNQFGASTAVTQYPNEPILIPAQGYPTGTGTGPSPTSGYPQPLLQYPVTNYALLLLASTQYG